MSRRTRDEWVRDEKRTAGPGCEKYSTLPEIAELLGRNETTLKRRLKAGRMPEPDAVTNHGWKLWSPATVRAMLKREMKQVKEQP